MSSTENSWCFVCFGACHTLPVPTTADDKALTPNPYESKISKLKLNQSWITNGKSIVYKKYSTIEGTVEKILGNYLLAYPSQVTCRVKARLWLLEPLQHKGGNEATSKRTTTEEKCAFIVLVKWMNSACKWHELSLCRYVHLHRKHSVDLIGSFCCWLWGRLGKCSPQQSYALLLPLLSLLF